MLHTLTPSFCLWCSGQEENDENYEEEPEVADVFDSDFDEDVCISFLSTFILIHIQ